MFRKILRSKIHRATITHADLHYEGSITIPPDLLKAADIKSYEAVSIWNVTRGTRFETYAIKGKKNTRDICVNGAAAHLVEPGDLIIIACFGYLKEQELKKYKPKLIFVDANNRITEQRKEFPGPELPPINSTEKLIVV
jgi:aspartate 1-decarboxylase